MNEYNLIHLIIYIFFFRAESFYFSYALNFLMITVLRIEAQALTILSKAPPRDCTRNVHHKFVPKSMALSSVPEAKNVYKCFMNDSAVLVSVLT